VIGKRAGFRRAARRFDDAVDEVVEPLRKNAALTSVAAAVSNLADYGFVWTVVASAKGRRRGTRRAALRRLGTAGVSSLALNAAIKAVVDRGRPEQAAANAEPGAIPVREPTSSSFPSGHTLAAFTTAVVLADSPAQAVAFIGFAAVVGASRIQLGAHHASDVAGGALIGAGLGALLRSTNRRRR
jgi:undecaprenyl-diphosphatase